MSVPVDSRYVPTSSPLQVYTTMPRPSPAPSGPTPGPSAGPTTRGPSSGPTTLGPSPGPSLSGPSGYGNYVGKLLLAEIPGQLFTETSAALEAAVKKSSGTAPPFIDFSDILQRNHRRGRPHEPRVLRGLPFDEARARADAVQLARLPHHRHQGRPRCPSQGPSSSVPSSVILPRFDRSIPPKSSSPSTKISAPVGRLWPRRSLPLMRSTPLPPTSSTRT